MNRPTEAERIEAIMAEFGRLITIQGDLRILATLVIAADPLTAWAETVPQWVSVKTLGYPWDEWCWLVIDGIVQKTPARMVVKEGMYYWQWADNDADECRYEVPSHYMILAPPTEGISK